MSLIFTNTALKGVNKVGLLKPDADGYYDVILGALEAPNSYGAIYKLQAAEEILAPGSPFQRRIEKGVLFGEYGHPRREPNMSDIAWMNRIHEVREDRVSHHIKEVRIDRNAVDIKGRRYIAIRGKIKPCGPYGKYITEMMESAGTPVSFSIRSLTNDMIVGGTREKHLIEVMTWDYVVEAGLEQAVKWNAPSLEEYSRFEVTPELVKQTISFNEKGGYSTESTQRLYETLDAFKRVYSAPVTNPKPWMNW